MLGGADWQELFEVVANNTNYRTRDLLTDWYLRRRPHLPDPASLPRVPPAALSANL